MKRCLILLLVRKIEMKTMRCHCYSAVRMHEREETSAPNPGRHEEQLGTLSITGETGNGKTTFKENDLADSQIVNAIATM